MKKLILTLALAVIAGTFLSTSAVAGEEEEGIPFVDDLAEVVAIQRTVDGLHRRTRVVELDVDGSDANVICFIERNRIAACVQMGDHRRHGDRD